MSISGRNAMSKWSIYDNKGRQAYNVKYKDGEKEFRYIGDVQKYKKKNKQDGIAKVEELKFSTPKKAYEEIEKINYISMRLNTLRGGYLKDKKKGEIIPIDFRKIQPKKFKKRVKAEIKGKKDVSLAELEDFGYYRSDKKMIRTPYGELRRATGTIDFDADSFRDRSGEIKRPTIDYQTDPQYLAQTRRTNLVSRNPKSKDFLRRFDK